MGDVPAPAITPGVLLSGMSLLSWPTGAMESLRSGRGPRVLVTLHSAGCLECRRYIQTQLAPASEQLAQWGGRLAVVLPFFVADAGVRHDLPRSGDLADWIRFLAIQCPECEGPEGEWRTIPRVIGGNSPAGLGSVRSGPTER